MPNKPPKVCARCKATVRDKCSSCSTSWLTSSKHWAQGSTRRWRKLRQAKLTDKPLCQTETCLKLATQVDHIKPLADGGERYDWDNLQSLCDDCHKTKTTLENQRRRK